MKSKLLTSTYYLLKRVGTRLPPIPIRRRHWFGTKLAVTLQVHTGYAIKGVQRADPGPMFALQDSLQAGDTFYDVGANIGLYSVAAGALVGPQGRVVALEPDPANCAQLLKNMRLNSTPATVLQLAASDEADITPFVLDPITSATGHLTSPGYTEPLVSEWSSVIVTPSQTTVRTVRLDDLVFGAKLPSPTTVKIDVERHELHVLRGMERIMKEIRPRVLIELGTQNTEVAHAFIEEAGYQVAASFGEDNYLLTPLT